MLWKPPAFAKWEWGEAARGDSVSSPREVLLSHHKIHINTHPADKSQHTGGSSTALKAWAPHSTMLTRLSIIWIWPRIDLKPQLSPHIENVNKFNIVISNLDHGEVILSCLPTQCNPLTVYLCIITYCFKITTWQTVMTCKNFFFFIYAIWLFPWIYFFP